MIGPKLTETFKKPCGHRYIRSCLLNLGADIVGDSPDQFDIFIKAGLIKWSKLIREMDTCLE